MSPVQERGSLRAPVAGLRARRVRRCWLPHSQLCAMRPRLLREDSQVLGGDPAPTRDTCLQTHLPLLLHCPQLPRLDAPHLPGSHRLAAAPQQTTVTVTGRRLSSVHVAYVDSVEYGLDTGESVAQLTHPVCKRLRSHQIW